jgi:hypothetical protein
MFDEMPALALLLAFGPADLSRGTSTRKRSSLATGRSTVRSMQSSTLLAGSSRSLSRFSWMLPIQMDVRASSAA